MSEVSQGLLPVQADDGLQGRMRYRAVFAVSLSVLLSVLDYAVVNVALPSIAHDIHTTDSASIWVVNAYQLTSLISLLPMAALGDRLGHARICRMGLILFLIASIFCAASGSLPELAAARALQGFGGACIMSVNVALVRFIYPVRALGRGIAFNGLIIALGVALGPTVAAGVLSFASWQFLFLINLPLGGAALAFAFTSLPRTPLSGGRFDPVSTALLAIGLGGVFVGGDSLAHHGGRVPALVLLVAGAGALFILVRRQLFRSDPLLPVDLLRIPAFRTAFITGFTGFMASNFFIISMPFNLETVLHRSPVATGFLITPWPVAIVMVAPLVGRLTDRYPAGLLSSLGLCITGLGFLALRLLPADPSNFDIVWRIALAGIGFGLFQPPNNKALVVTAPPARVGSASGMLSVARLLGQTVGAMLVAMTFSLVAQSATLTCLSLAAATAFAATVISATRLKKKAA